ncbi:heat shock transcription factor, X-linked member 4 [Hippopotamus amphibius kiboko]|uniref:heat shock transcription factor, X-linked member 4 n=1 Tax=Hippopotamus amphibius kiboko TaxID=575201 RepID=UPI002593921D|nr:heat shock transcription factor, X-linked member 4 [Hippopotamus amphibius kiboko]
MASESSDEACAATLAPSAGAEPATGDPSHSPLDPHVDPGEISEKHGDPAEGPGPGSEDAPAAQGPDQGAAKQEGNNDILGLSFPRKLWMIVEDEAFTSVRWNNAGDTVIVEADLFQREILHRMGADRIFETDSLKTFIRQLNLYGFRKIRPTSHSPRKKRLMIYRNCNFKRDNPLLIENIQRKGGPRPIAWPGTGATTPKTKKHVAATRCSPRIHRDNSPDSTKGAHRKVRKEAPTAQGPSSTRPFPFSGMWSMSSIARGVAQQHPPGEQGSPSGEGTSRNVIFVPPAIAGRDGTGELPTAPPVYPGYSSVVSLYNTCYSILLAALSAMAPNEAPQAEEEQEGSSDYKCALCEQFKENPNP